MMSKSKTLQHGLSLQLTLVLCISIVLPSTALAADPSGETGGDSGTSITFDVASDLASSDEITAEEETESEPEEKANSIEIKILERNR